jgi:ribosomal protein L12E/L44/L45/RPP1/RPP2
MNDQDTIDELFTEWVNANQDRIRFAAWLKTLTEQDIDEVILKIKNPNSRCEDAPCCGCCD